MRTRENETRGGPPLTLFLALTHMAGGNATREQAERVEGTLWRERSGEYSHGHSLKTTHTHTYRPVKYTAPHPIIVTHIATATVFTHTHSIITHCTHNLRSCAQARRGKREIFTTSKERSSVCARKGERAMHANLKGRPRAPCLTLLSNVPDCRR